MAKTKAATYTNDQHAESVLGKLKIKYRLEEISLGDINWKATDNNFSRTHRKYDQDRVDDYALAMMDGDSFPRVIAIEQDGEYVILAGVHRSHAAKEAKVDCVGAYVIVDAMLPQQQLMLATMHNRLGGRRVEKEEAYLLAIDLIASGELDANEVSSLLGISASVLQLKLRSTKIMRQAEAAGFRGSLPQTTWQAMTRVSSIDKVLVACAQYFSNNKHSVQDVNRFVRSVAGERSEAQQIAYIEKATAIMPTPENNGDSKPIKLRTFTKWLRAMHCLATITGDRNLEQIQIVRGSDTHKQVSREVGELIKSLRHAIK